ncbi:uncharacterized protein LOC135500466 [Lineus longissimus]|uniref:uncharacterized protein LOC135500466 n=1 Tax=Lineus longissimus TaxID=88925 RepID=UPI002B4DDE43
MPVTTLSFFRKRQTLEHLERERPKSLAAVRQALHQATDAVEFELDQVERIFYGNAHPEKEIRKWVPVIFNVMKTTDMTEIKLMLQFSQMLEKAKEPSRKFQLEPNSIEILNECITKIRTSTPDMFYNVMAAIQRIHTYLHKYCLSFCSLKRNDPYLETAQHYELNRRELSETISTMTAGVVELMTNFKTTGLDMASFSLNTKEMARRCDCATIPFVLLFPESCEKIRVACKAIRRWLEADEQYPSFIKNDVNDLEKKQTFHSRLVRESQEKIFQLEYRLRHIKKELCETEGELDKLMKRNASLQDHEAQVLAEYSSMKLEMEIKDVRRAELRSRASHMRPADYNEANDRLINETNALKERMNATYKAVENIQLKMKWIEERKEKVQAVKERMGCVKADLKHLRSENRKFEMELERLNDCLSYLKRVHLLKTSPDVLKKIFHNLPLISNSEQFAKQKTDVLERASRVTSRLIDQDWKKLYRALPFVPHRGEEMLHNDIDQIDKSFVRGNNQELALECLRRWRRVHNRSNLEDLKQALHLVGRPDVLWTLEEALKPKPKPKPPIPRSQRRPMLMKVFAF